MNMVFTQGQLEEAIKLLPHRLPQEGERTSTEVASIRLVDTRVDSPASSIQLAPIDQIVWGAARDCFRTTLNVDFEPFEFDAHGGLEGFAAAGLKVGHPPV